MARTTNAQLREQLAEQAKQIEQLTKLVEGANGNGKARGKANGKSSKATPWYRIVSKKSPLRVIGQPLNAPGFDFVEKVDKLTVGQSLELPGGSAAKKLLNSSFVQSGFTGTWDDKSRNMVYDHVGSKSGKTPGLGMKFQVHIAERSSDGKQARTVTRLA